MPDLGGRIALVIGGATGIGLASARALAAAGAEVVIADRDGEGAVRGADALNAVGGKATAFAVDIGSRAQLGALFDFVERTHGRLNLLFSNVGVRGPDGFDVTDEQFDEVMDLNLKSHFFATRLAIPLLARCARQASIVYMSSAAGLRFFGRSPLYSISKAALLMMARTFARDLATKGIRVNALCPGAVDTEFPSRGVDPERRRELVERWSREIPLGRLADPAEIASVVAFLASDQSSYMTGLSIPLDGGVLA